MSLLDDRRHHLRVFPEIESTDSLGSPIRVPDEEHPIDVHGRMQPSSSSEVDDQNSSTFYTFRGRGFPAGQIARVEWVDRNGWAFDVSGEPRRADGSDRTRHSVVALKARTSEPPLED